MVYTPIEAEIDHGNITVKDPATLPQRGRGILIVLPETKSPAASVPGRRARLPLIQGDGQRIINPTPEELDDSLWGEDR